MSLGYAFTPRPRWLLASALRVAVGDTAVDPLRLLEALAALTADDLDRLGFVVERERAAGRSVETSLEDIA